MASPKEEWRVIPGHERYYVSNLGHIAVLRNGELVGRKLNSATTYLTVSLAGKPQKSICVHHAVALAFHGPRPSGSILRHLDGNRYNNAASNIAYGTPSENYEDSKKHRTHKGINNGRSKLDERDVAAIKSLLRDGVGTSAIGRAFGVTPAQIGHIRAGRQWSHIEGVDPTTD